MPANPKVSICIPTYRGDAHLGKTIESVLAQDYEDYELVIIDDNSPDQTSSVVASYQDNRIRYIKNTSNFGPEGNWNRCLEEAKGEYFKLLPQDDVLEPSCIRQQVDILDQDQAHSIALVFCARYIIDSDGKTITKRGYPAVSNAQINGKTVIRKCIGYGANLIGEPGAVMFRKTLADQVGKFNGHISYIIDLDYWVRLLLKGDAYCLKAPLASFRVSSGSWSVAIGTKQSDEYNRFIDQCASNPECSLRASDIYLGKIMSTINNYLRLIFYKFFIPKNKI
jgi:glycosyltransferase involved in cell wall biosynthesis